MRPVTCYLLFLFNQIMLTPAAAQVLEVQQQDHTASLRGLCVVNDRVIWASGSKGTAGLSIDSGRTWKWMTVKGYEKSDFRDIEAFDETSAVIMGITQPACILRTADAGATWKVCLQDTTPALFLDAMEFWNINSGIVIGDPVNNRFFIARSFDGGRSWRGIPETNRPAANTGEALFAASGSNIRKLNNQEAIFVTGGSTSRLFYRNKTYPLPMIQGRESAGAFSLAVKNEQTWIVVGGQYDAPEKTDSNCMITHDAGKSWNTPATAPQGYLSCIEYISKETWVACGPGGVQITEDDGKHWRRISTEGFHTCRIARKGKVLYLSGGKGRTGRLSW